MTCVRFMSGETLTLSESDLQLVENEAKRDEAKTVSYSVLDTTQWVMFYISNETELTHTV